MEMLRYQCPACSKRVKYTLAQVGRKVACPSCRNQLELPPEPAEAAQPAIGAASVAAPVESAIAIVPAPVEPQAESTLDPDIEAARQDRHGEDWGGRALGVFFFTLFGIVPVFVPLMIAVGAPSEGHILLVYLLVGNLPSIGLGVVEAYANGRSFLKWTDLLMTMTQPEPKPSIDYFRPHLWAKWGALILAIVGTIGTIVVAVLYTAGFVRFLAEGVQEAETKTEAIFKAVIGLFIGTIGGALLGYCYGLYLGALADTVLWIAGHKIDQHPEGDDSGWD